MRDLRADICGLKRFWSAGLLVLGEDIVEFVEVMNN